MRVQTPDEELHDGPLVPPTCRTGDKLPAMNNNWQKVRTPKFSTREVPVNAYHTRVSYPYPGDDTFHIPHGSRLLQCLRPVPGRVCGLGDNAFLASLLANGDASGSFDCTVAALRPVIHDGWDRGQFCSRRRPALDPRRGSDDRLLVIDRWGNGWWWIAGTGIVPSVFLFQTVSHPVDPSKTTGVSEAALLERAAKHYRRLYLLTDLVTCDIGLWTDFKFGWAPFWQPGWVPTVNPIPSRRHLYPPRG